MIGNCKFKNKVSNKILRENMKLWEWLMKWKTTRMLIIITKEQEIFTRGFITYIVLKWYIISLQAYSNTIP